MGYVLITGGNLVNKGAQAMTFIAVDEVKRRFPEKEVVVVSDVDAARSDEELSQYRFLFRDGTCLFGKKYKLVQRRYGRLDRHGDAAYIRKHVDRIIDVSGYTFGSCWGVLANLLAAYRAEQAAKIGAPIYFMPQSFGPFEWKGLRRMVVNHFLKKWFRYIQVFYCREKEGCDLMRNRYHIKRVKYGADLVLANRGVDDQKLFYSRPGKEEYDRVIAGIKPHSVGILPNMRNDSYATAEAMDALYQPMIDKLLEMGRTVYLIRHAAQDAACCSRLKSLYERDGRVILLETDFDCFAYSALAARFDYLVASRYHAVVHAYKEGTPCIIPGWAVKYKELSEHFGQQDYFLDVRAARSKQAADLIVRMEENYQKERETIRGRLDEVQRKNVFDILGSSEERKRDEEKTSATEMEEIARYRKCVSCGICAAVCPADCIHYERTDGYYLPVFTKSACVDCGRCRRVCYAKVKMADIPFRKPRFALTAQARDEELLKRATSGGAVTALVTRLLQDGVYDNAYLVEGFEDKGQLTTREFTAGDDLSVTQKSRYVPVSQQRAVEGILAEPDKRSIYVGTACAVYGLLQALKLSGRDREQVLVIGLFCDRMQTYSIYDYFREHYRRHEPERGNMKELYFRDKRAGGWPGNMRVTFEDGSSIDVSAKERMILKDFFRGRRCVSCTDKLNRQADLSVGDNYTGENSGKQGTNSVLIYTERGEAAWKHCEDAFLTFPSSAEEICKSQHTTWEDAFACTKDGLTKVEPREVSDDEELDALVDYMLGEMGHYELIESKKKEKLKQMYRKALRERLRERLHL